MMPATADPRVLLLQDAPELPAVWAGLRQRPGDPGRAVTLDLRGLDAEAMVARVVGDLRMSDPAQVVLVAQGGGAAVAALATRQVEDGTQHALRSLVFLDASFGRDEAWSRRVGVLQTPALLMTVADDADAQASLIAPHFTRARLHLVDHGDAPLAAILGAVLDDGVPEVRPEPAIDAAYATLIASDRVTSRTREVLRARARPLPPSPAALTPPLLAILRAVVALVLPLEDDDPQVDIARRIDEVLASGDGDGWRHASLPPDAEAMAAALRTLDDAARAVHGRPFLCLAAAARQTLLDGAEQGALAGHLDAPAMALWFSELRREAARAWISHPAVLGRLGYSGIGSVGGDTAAEPGRDQAGFSRVGPDSTEAWEPRAW